MCKLQIGVFGIIPNRLSSIGVFYVFEKGVITIDDYKKYVSDFKQYLFEDGKSENTIASYVGDVEKFYEWLLTKDTVVDGLLKRFYITSYKKYLVDQKYKVNTVNKKINSLSCYNAYLISAGVMTEMVVNLRKDKMKIACGSEHKVEVLSDDDVERLLFLIEDQSKVSKRDKAIILVLLYCGLRVSECTGLLIDNIDFITRQLTVVGKGLKERTIPCRKEVIVAIRDYMETERKKNKHNASEYLFLSNRSVKMDRDAIARRLKKYGDTLNIKLYPHLFRHTFCTNLVKKNVNISTVSKLAGHSSVNTTMSNYLNISTEEMANAVDKL